MSTEQFDHPGRNQRSDFRCAVGDTYEQASLKTDTAEYPVQLVNESAGGFAVRVPGPLPLEANDLVRLHTSAGWFQVRVANVREEDVEAAGEGQGAEPSPRIFRLGLQRLRDVEPWDDPTTHASWFSRLPLATLPSFENPLALVGTGTIALFGLIILAAGLFMWQAGYPVTELFNLNQSKSSSHGSVLPRLKKHLSKSLRSVGKALPAGWVHAPSTQPASPSNPTNPTNPASSAKRTSSSVHKSNLRGMINRLSGATVFTLPDMVKELSLTKSQQAEIRKITEASSDAVRHIDRYWKAGNRREQTKARAQMHEEALKHALGTLTDEQRKKWKELKGGR